MDISSDRYIKEFFSQRDITNPNTKKTYLIRLRKYCEFLGKTPTELIDEAVLEEDKGIRMKDRQIKEHLLDFKTQLQDDGKSYNTLKTYIAVIMGFYHEHEIDTPRIKIKNHELKQQITTNDIVGKKHIKKALKISNVKYRAIILLMSSSGMGSAEVRSLTYKIFLNAISEYYEPPKTEQFNIPLIVEKLRNNDNLILTWQIVRQKTGKPYTTFSTPEATQSLLDYLEERNRENKPIRKIDDPLFLSGSTELDRSAMLKYFAELNDTCNFGYSGKNRFFTSHKLRKFFASTLTEYHISELYTRWLLGHDLDKTVNAYFKPNIKELKNEYTKIIPKVSIESVEIKRVTTKEYDQLLDKLRKKDEEITNINKRMAALEGLLGNDEYLKDRLAEN
jgi:integrase